MYEGLNQGICLALELHNVLYLTGAVMVGIVLGAIPGFNPSTAMVVLLPFTYFLAPDTALIFLSGVAGAAIYGGSITAILFGTPGTIGSVVTMIDGYKLTQKGKGVFALGISGAASAFGGLLAGLSLFLFAPPLAQLATKFSFPEIFLLILWAFAIIGGLQGDFLKSLAAGAFGIVLSSIGADPINAYPRMTFNLPDLFDGVNLVTAIMGYFCFSEMMRISQKTFLLNDKAEYQGGYLETIEGLNFTLRHPFITLRGSLVGIIIGALPAAGTAIANMISYSMQKRISTHPETYGTGDPEGLLAAESANNATEGSCFIPAITLGIPGSNIAAILMTAMTLHGIQAGPRIFYDHGPVVFSLIVATIYANFIMFGISLASSKYISRLTTLSVDRLIPWILVFMLIGVFAVRNSSFDFIIMVIFGVMAYFMNAQGYSVTAMVLPFVLGGSLEQSFLISMAYSDNTLTIFFKSTICIILWMMIGATIFLPPLLKHLSNRRNSKAAKV